MTAKLLDADLILSGNEQWMKLNEDWKTIDLETDEDQGILTSVLSTLDLRKSTFDSSFLTKKVRRKVGRQFSKKSMTSLNYKEFLQDLNCEEEKQLPLKQFYFISGEIISALSVEDICDKIDDIFKSVEKLCSATSTIRPKKKIPEIVHCSISASDLSFDDTTETEKEKGDEDDIDKFIDEAFDHLNLTIGLSLDNIEESKGTVTSLVQKFSNILTNPNVHCSPRRKRYCSEKFKELAEFWKNKAGEGN